MITSKAKLKETVEMILRDVDGNIKETKTIERISDLYGSN